MVKENLVGVKHSTEMRHLLSSPMLPWLERLAQPNFGYFFFRPRDRIGQVRLLALRAIRPEALPLRERGYSSCQRVKADHTRQDHTSSRRLSRSGLPVTKIPSEVAQYKRAKDDENRMTTKTRARIR